jgi:hypothetical protein
MGSLMRRCLAMVAIFSVAFAARGASAQVDGRVFTAGGVGEMVLGSLAMAQIATRMCGVGDPETLSRVVAAIDRRFRFCVGKDAVWSSLIAEFKQEELDSRAQGSGRSLGTFSFESLLRKRGPEAEARGATAYCASLPWKMLLEPAAATEEAKAEFRRTRPQAPLDEALSLFGWILDLGRDTAWVEAPCGKDFWPEYSAPKK